MAVGTGETLVERRIDERTPNRPPHVRTTPPVLPGAGRGGSDSFQLHMS